MKSDSHNYQVLPVAIMAHNEARVLRSAIDSALDQEIPEGYSVQVIVTANGCTDDTEEIVKGYEGRFPGRVKLLSIREKGKTKAINETIRYLDGLDRSAVSVPYVIFLDADSKFAESNVLVKFIQRFSKEPKLCAIGADCVPDVCLNPRKDMTAEMYRALYRVKQAVDINTISGMCYAIRFHVLKQIAFPEIHFAEDMYLSARLNGWFLNDRDIRIVFRTPPDLATEIRRRARQEVSTQRFLEYYKYLRSRGSLVRLFSGNLGDGYRWGGADRDDIIEAWSGLVGVKAKALLILAYAIRGYSKIKSLRALRTIRKNHALDYWEVSR